MEKINKIIELGIDIDNYEEELFDGLGVEVISIVEHPAIEESFLYFNSDEPHEHSGDDEMTPEFEDAVILYAEAEGDLITHNDVVVDMTKDEFATVTEVVNGLRALDVLQRLELPDNYVPELLFRYQGNGQPQRSFCKAMMNLSARGKMFTKGQINQMDRLNPDFARHGETSYSIFKWKGGKQCRHFWQKLFVFKNDSGDRVIIVTNPNTPTQEIAGKTWAEMFSTQYDFKIVEEQRMLVGPVMVPNRMILRRDQNGEPFYVFFSRKTIRKMAEKFLEQNKQHNTDIEHDGLVTTNNKLVESWVSDSVVHDKSYSMGFGLPQGTWYVSYRIHDEETWQNIKEGRLKGFSLSGQFINRFTPGDESVQ